MSTPTLAASYLVTSPAASIASLTTPSFTPAIGEVLVVKALAESSVCVIGAASGGSLTYTTNVTDSTASTCYCKLFTALTNSTAAMTVSVAFSGTTGWHSMVVERWQNAQLAAAPATVDTRGSGAPSATITATSNASVISWSNGDFSAIAPGSRAYRAGAIDEGVHDKSTLNYVAYYAYQQVAVKGTQTVGLTAPVGETFKVVGIEILPFDGFSNNYQFIKVGNGMSVTERIR